MQLSQANPEPAPNSTTKNADDIVITVAIRTPLTKARKGAFKDSGIEYLTYVLLKELKARSGIDPALVEDFAFGNVRFFFSPMATQLSRRFHTDTLFYRSTTPSPPPRSVPPPSPPASPTPPVPMP